MTQRQEKKNQFQEKKKSGFLPFLVAGLVVLSAAGLMGWKAVGGVGRKHPAVSAENGMVRLAENQVNDGKAHFFTFKSGGTNVDFFVLKSRDGVIRTAFDTCDTCWTSGKGYKQAGDFMICQNCRRRFRTTEIGLIYGGCNPAPLKSETRGNTLVILPKALLEGRPYFDLPRGG